MYFNNIIIIIAILNSYCINSLNRVISLANLLGIFLTDGNSFCRILILYAIFIYFQYFYLENTPLTMNYLLHFCWIYKS